MAAEFTAQALIKAVLKMNGKHFHGCSINLLYADNRHCSCGVTDAVEIATMLELLRRKVEAKQGELL